MGTGVMMGVATGGESTSLVIDSWLSDGRSGIAVGVGVAVVWAKACPLGGLIVACG